MLFKITKSYRNLSLQNIITLPFLLQIFITVGLVGSLSWHNGEQAVNRVTKQLRNEVTAGVEKHLESYLETPHLIVRLKQNAIKFQQLALADFPGIQQDFWSTIQLFDSVRAIYIADEAGKFIYLKQEEGKIYAKEVTEVSERKTHLLDSSGQKKELVEVDEYDPRQRPWYINTQLTKRNNWSKIYPFTGGELGITAAGLLKDSQGNNQGIVGVDLILSGIGNFLQSIKISDNGQVFILERNGYLVATSTDEKPFTYDQVKGKEKRLRASDSNDSLTLATSKHINEHFRSLYNIDRPEQLDFKLQGDRQLVQVLPYQDGLGLDWLIVVVIPEADFMAEINANTSNTIWLCLAALVIATLFGVYTSRRIAQPITVLSQVANLVAQSAKARSTGTNLYPIVKAKSIKELKLLAQSFNEMVIQLKAAFRDLENTNEELENRVQQRTKALVTAKEAADAANRAKSEFLANMSHELRTPLHAILGFTQVSLQDSALKPQQRENLVTVKRSGEHLLTLINDILEMSKIEAGSVSVKEKQFDLHLLLANIAKMFDSRSQNKNIELIFDLAPDLPQYIETDPLKLNQILINLIENGIKFTEQGKVTLKVKPAREYSSSKNRISDIKAIAFTVEDTGYGILPSDLESIFIPFTQSNQDLIYKEQAPLTQPKSTLPQEGTGLGLAISQQFVRLLGGEISVTSVLEQGSTFEFEIPITVVDPSQFLANSAAQPSVNKAKLPLNKNKRQQNLSAPQSLSKGLSFRGGGSAKSRGSLPKAINVSTLASMQSEWLSKLEQAAIEVDPDLILQLIEQIPSAKNSLAQGLTRMLKNFEYDEIIELAQQAISNQ